MLWVPRHEKLRIKDSFSQEEVYLFVVVVVVVVYFLFLFF